VKNFLGRILTGLAILGAAGPGWGAESPLLRFVGTPSCASSSCHGGAGPRRDQVGLWESRDVHRRASSTLNVARSDQIGLALGMTNALGQPSQAQNPRCTACHAPNATVPANLRLAELDRAEGVACETCHAPAEPWLRSHTRPGPPRDEFTYADKVAAGMRDLRDLRVRANVCVACHENVERALLEAGHPELVFELDGQTRQEPRHWVEKPGHHGAKAWLVGQAVAWREVAWLSTQPGEKTDRLGEREAGLAWLVNRAAKSLGITETAPDAIARVAAGRNWSDADTRSLLQTFAGSAAEFRAGSVPASVQARRADRVVLGLDRLLAATSEATGKLVETEVNALFKLAQSRPDFAPARFGEALEALAAKLPSAPAN